MSEIAGRLLPQIGAHYLGRPAGGRGILLGGAAGVSPSSYTETSNGSGAWRPCASAG
jgi:alanine dehydrogenase